jgi:predicted DNA-binding antitoxin AbrB/MazE fold protein
MTQTVEAIYQNGSFRVIEPKDIPLHEGQNVRLTIEASGNGDDILALATDVYDGLSESEIDEIEEIALDRTDFFDRK